MDRLVEVRTARHSRKTQLEDFHFPCTFFVLSFFNKDKFIIILYLRTFLFLLQKMEMRKLYKGFKENEEGKNGGKEQLFRYEEFEKNARTTDVQ